MESNEQLQLRMDKHQKELDKLELLNTKKKRESHYDNSVTFRKRCIEILKDMIRANS